MSPESTLQTPVTELALPPAGLWEGRTGRWDKLAGKRWWSTSEVNRFSLIRKSLGSSLTRQPFARDLFLICYAFKLVFSGSVLLLQLWANTRGNLGSCAVSRCYTCSVGTDRGCTLNLHFALCQPRASFCFLVAVTHISHLVPPLSKRKKEMFLTNHFAVWSLRWAFNPAVFNLSKCCS